MDCFLAANNFYSCSTHCVLNKQPTISQTTKTSVLKRWYTSGQHAVPAKFAFRMASPLFLLSVWWDWHWPMDQFTSSSTRMVGEVGCPQWSSHKITIRPHFRTKQARMLTLVIHFKWSLRTPGVWVLGWPWSKVKIVIHYGAFYQFYP